MKRGKSKGISPLVGLAALVAIAFIVSGGNLFSSIGFSTLSLSSVNFQSNDPDVGGDAWILLINNNGGGQSATGTFLSSQISSGTKQANEGFTLEVNNVRNDVEYQIRNDAVPLYVYSYSNIGFQLDPVGACNQRGSQFTVKPSGSLSTYCIFRTQFGTKGSILQGNYIFESDIKVTKGSQVDTAKINNVQQTSVKVGNNVFAQFQGFLASGRSIPNDPDIIVVYANQGGQWKTASLSRFTQWQSSSNGVSSGSCIQNEADVQRCINLANGDLSFVLNGRSFVSNDGIVAKTITSSATSGKVVFEFGKQLMFPVMTLKVKASYLGIVVNVGDPAIVSVSSPTFASGTNQGYIEVVAKNVGSASGTFDVSAVCNSPFSSNDVARVTLAAQEQASRFLTVTASVSSPQSGTCNVKVLDVNSGKSVQQSVSVSATPTIICNAGEKTVFGKQILQCNQAGSGFTVIAECPDGEIPDPVSFTCVKEDTGGGGGLFGFLGGFGGILDNIGNFVIVALILVAAIVILPKVMDR